MVKGLKRFVAHLQTVEVDDFKLRVVRIYLAVYANSFSSFCTLFVLYTSEFPVYTSLRRVYETVSLLEILKRPYRFSLIEINIRHSKEKVGSSQRLLKLVKSMS